MGVEYLFRKPSQVVLVACNLSTDRKWSQLQLNQSRLADLATVDAAYRQTDGRTYLLTGRKYGLELLNYHGKMIASVLKQLDLKLIYDISRVYFQTNNTTHCEPAHCTLHM